MVHEFAVLIEYSNLYAAAETWVEGQNSFMASGWRKQDVLKILGENLKSFFFSCILESQAHFTFHAGLEQTFPCIFAHFGKVRLPDAVCLDDLLLQIANQLFIGHFHG